MEVKVPKERIDELMKRIRERTLNQYMSGSVVDLVVIDAIDMRNLLAIAAFDNEWNLNAYNILKSEHLREVLEGMVDLLENLKCCVVKCRAIGARILTVAYVEEFQGTIPQELVKVGVVRRTRMGSRIWLEAEDGRYLVNDASVKGALLTAKAEENEIVAFTGYSRKRKDINIVNYIHWMRVESGVDRGT